MYRKKKDNVFKRLWSWVKRHKVISIIIAVLLVLIIAAAVFVEVKLNMIHYNNGVASAPQSSANDNNDEDEDLTKGLKDATTEFSDSKIFDDKNVTNILLLGTDERTSSYSENARSDSMMILSINKEKHTAKLVSLERGQGVPILDGEYKGQYDWLTHCFRYGGAKLVMQEVQYCYKVKIDRFVQCNFDSFQKVIDAVGGVDIEIKDQYVCDALNGKSYTRTKNPVKVGINHLDGYDALAYSRLRSCDSDWQRIERQRQTLQAFADKTKDLNLIEFNNLIDTILPLMQTNLSQIEILQLVSIAPSLKGAHIDQMTLPQKGTYGSMKGMGDRPMFAVDFAKNADILQKFLYN